MMRLDKYLSENTEYSRSQVRDFVKKGRVCVNSSVIKKSDVKIDEENDIITLDGDIIEKKGFLYVVMNKPKGYVCATEDKNEKTVIDLLPDDLKNENLFPAGRLDKDSTGLVVLTNDGDFAHKLISPKTHAEKQYLVELDRSYEDFYTERISNGIELSDGTKCQPAEVYKLSDKKCVIKLTEGKYHQVRRMFAALGNHVNELTRIAIGNYVLTKELPLGNCMVLLHKEENDLLAKSVQHFFEGDFNTVFSS